MPDAGAVVGSPLERVITKPAPSFAAEGFVPGLAVHLRIRGGNTNEILSTVVEAISADRVEVLVPIHQRRRRTLTEGSTVRGEYMHLEKEWKFVAGVLGHSADFSYEYLTLPERLECSERRSRFRLKTALPPTGAWRVRHDPETAEEELTPIAKAQIVDLSEGGLCVVSPGTFFTGDVVRVQTTLGDIGEIVADAMVIAVQEPAHGNQNRRAHCRFLAIARADQERIARYLMRRQIELRKGGYL